MSPGDPELLTEAAYQRALVDLANRYSIETIEVNFGSASFSFTRVTDPGDVPLDLDDNGQLLWQPYWAEDWESSRALCRLLLSKELKGQTVLDLGCGLGLTGAVAASRGARVLLADHAEPALSFSKVNCWRWKELCQFERLDWKVENPGLPRFDWIVGAEIIYDSDDWDYLNVFWKNHLTAEGRILLCDPFRRTGREFREWITSHHWEAEFSELSVPEFDRPVNVMELWSSDS